MELEPEPRTHGARTDVAERRTTASTMLVFLQMTSLQLGAVFATGLAARIGAVPAATLRLGFAAVFTWIAVRPKVGRITRGDLPLVVTFGAVLAVMNASFFAAISRLPLGVATTLEFLGPLAVVLISAARFRDRIWGLVAAAGVVLLTWNLGHLDGWGIGFALVAATCRALYIVGSKRIGQRYGNADGLCFALAVGFVLALPFGAVIGGRQLLQQDVLLTGMLVALLSSAVPYLCDLYALRHLPSHVFGILVSMAPAGGALAGFLLLDQVLRPVQAAGIALVVAASIGALMGTRRRARVASAASTVEPESGSPARP
ncbi:DMT family transporter [Polymorphospora lycopeni]|uniref:EamA family transporter n=1 Tax=Polymorphospora lycopeni TaxID=3140240 RepID=A0ABV5CPC7_9ACTN